MTSSYINVARKTLFWYITIRGGNGEVLLTSETYYSKSNAFRAARALSETTGLDIRGNN